MLTSVRTKSKKIQFAQLEYWKDRCREGNSIGSCNDYFEALRSISKQLQVVSDKCQIKYSDQNEKFLQQLAQAIQIMALVAWGEKPPIGVTARLGWLNESNIKTFCHLKKAFILVGGDESFLSLREKIYHEFPGEWPANFDVNKLVQSNPDTSPSDKKKEDELDVAKLVANNRPRAYQTLANPSGTLTKEQIFERSIFSIRCDLYM